MVHVRMSTGGMITWGAGELWLRSSTHSWWSCAHVQCAKLASSCSESCETPDIVTTSIQFHVFASTFYVLASVAMIYASLPLLPFTIALVFRRVSIYWSQNNPHAGKSEHVFRACVPHGQYNPRMSKSEYRDMNRVLQVNAAPADLKISHSFEAFAHVCMYVNEISEKCGFCIHTSLLLTCTDASAHVCVCTAHSPHPCVLIRDEPICRYTSRAIRYLHTRMRAALCEQLKAKCSSSR